MRSVPERLRWAVETLHAEPADHVLEFGCGPGVAASLICDRLDEGTMLAIDRSEIQIDRARSRGTRRTLKLGAWSSRRSHWQISRLERGGSTKFLRST